MVAGTSLIAGTYGLVRLAYGLFLSDIQESIGLTAAQGGYVASGASVVYVAAALAGIAADRHPHAVLVAATGTASLGAAGMALAPGAATFVPAAIISSAGAGLASPGLVGIVSRGVRSEHRDRAQALVNSGTGPGVVAAGALALVVLPQWRTGFAVGAGVTALAGVLVLALTSQRWSVGGQVGPVEPAQPADRPWPALVRLRGAALGALLLGVASASVWTYGRAHLVAEGLGITASTIAWMALGVGGAATVLTSAGLARLAPARAWAVTTCGVAAAIALLGLVGSRPGVAAVACLTFGWSFVAATSALIAWASALAPGRAAGGTAVLFVTLTLGQALGATVVAVVAEHSGRTPAFEVAAVVALLAAACGGDSPRRVRPRTRR